jgi:hypothetical protein
VAAIENDHDHGDDNYSYTIGFATTTDQPTLGKSSSAGNGSSINIQNPYIKLIYCKKN